MSREGKNLPGFVSHSLQSEDPWQQQAYSLGASLSSLVKVVCVLLLLPIGT